MTTEVRVIDETTAEMQLAHACPMCDGDLELRLSPDGARSFCSTCHTIQKPRVPRDPVTGWSLDFLNVGLA
ncbi:MAG: hypothetical protein DI536_32110 [Archangium gephyra]|uniref:Uncharacterized protein n=1 Tax=Archangium gephyra TaxID=48 RepID=A0A2W5V680_9BACT|nr:MAG: hypothetical protein DI536_32110 [Archangium gephyra]